MRISDWSSDVCSSDLEGWFAAYLAWLTTSRFGTEERDEENNHGSCWLLQAASFAALLGRGDILADARTRLKTIIIPTQIAPDGSQPLEVARAKPYAYALFNLDVLAAAAWLPGGPEQIGWTTADHRSIGRPPPWRAPPYAPTAQ